MCSLASTCEISYAVHVVILRKKLRFYVNCNQIYVIKSSDLIECTV